MSKLPVVSGNKVIRALVKVGYYVRGKESNHVHLRHPDRKPLTMPDHRGITRGTLRTIIREAGFTVDEFRQLL